MGYAITCKVTSNCKLDVAVFDMLKRTPKEVQERIKELEAKSDDIMTVAELRELERLHEVGFKRTVDFNGAKITTDWNYNPREVDAYYDRLLDKVYIPGYEGDDLEFIRDGDFFVLDKEHIDDNYDTSLERVHRIIEAFEATCDIIYISDEEGGSENDGKIVYRYIDGEQI